MRPMTVVVAMLSTPALCLGAAAEFRVRDVPSATVLDAAQIEPGTIVFSDHRSDELTDPATGLIRFADWERTRPAHRQFLNLHPAYLEPVINVTNHGVTKQRQERLHMYVVEARFVVRKPPGAIDLARYATPAFLERIDPAIRHRTIAAADAVPNKDPEQPYNKRPDRRWCEAAGRLTCIESRYQLEGKLPMGVRLANKLEEGGKKIADTIEFQSELRALPSQEINQASLARLTGLDAPVMGVLEHSKRFDPPRR